jgi:transposase-like protein
MSRILNWLKKHFSRHPKVTSVAIVLAPEEKIIAFLKANPDRAYSTVEIARELGVVVSPSFRRTLRRLREQDKLVSRSSSTITYWTIQDGHRKGDPDCL